MSNQSVACHRDQFIWFRCSESVGVIGIEPDIVIPLIIRWNRSRFWRYGVDFWQWFSNEVDVAVHGFSVIWNEGNPAMNKVPVIFGGVNW